MGGYGGGGCFCGLALAGKFFTKGNFGVSEFAGGKKRARNRRIAEDRGADTRAGSAANYAGRGEDPASAAKQGVLSAEAQQSGSAGEQPAGLAAAEGL